MERISHVDYVRTVLKPFKSKIKRLYEDRRGSGSFDLHKISVDFLKQEKRLYAIDHEISVIQGKLFLLSRNTNNTSQVEIMNDRKKGLFIEEKIIRDYITDMDLMLTLSV